MTRLPDWDRRLALVTEKHMRLPGEWGVSDCLLTAADAIEAVTGNDVMAKWRGRYKTETGAARMLRREGCETVDDAMRLVFGLKPKGRLMAQRGDVGTMMRGDEIVAGYFCEHGFAAKGEGGLVFHPVTDVLAAYEVG